MALLTRYKKRGGFIQLLRLIETCSPQKREKLLKTVESENPQWAEELKKKMLTIERILSWPEDILSDIGFKTQNLTLAIVLQEMSVEDKKRFLSKASHRREKNLLEFSQEQNPGAMERITANINLIETVRDMIDEGYIELREVDPQMAIHQDIEERLSQHADSEKNGGTTGKAAPIEIIDYSENNKSSDKYSETNQLAFLKSELHKYKEENKQLKKQLFALEQQLLKKKSA